MCCGSSFQKDAPAATVLKRNLIHVARFEAFIVFRGDRDGVDDNVSVGNILRGQAILDPVRALGFNFYLITGFRRRVFQRLGCHEGMCQAHRAGAQCNQFFSHVKFLL